MTTHRTLFAGVHASSVGTGIANAIFAVAAAHDGPEAWVHFCITAADEARASVMDNPPLQPDTRGPAERQADKWITESHPERTGEHAPPPITGEALTNAAHAAAVMAFRCCMPKLTGRKHTQAYIACVAAGVQRGYFTGSEARSLLYTAQLALTAYPSRRANRGRK